MLKPIQAWMEWAKHQKHYLSYDNNTEEDRLWNELESIEWEIEELEGRKSQIEDKLYKLEKAHKEADPEIAVHLYIHDKQVVITAERVG